MLKPAVEVHNVDGILVAEFWDCFRLDPAPVQELRKLYESHLASKGRPEAVIDLLGVGYAGSAALGNFMAMHRLAKQRGGRLIFCNVDPTVFEVFRVSKLDPLFTFSADRASALVEANRQEPLPAPDPASAPLASTTTPAVAPAPLRKSGGDGLISASRRRKLS
ncbi:STAS domain-containing protein [Singulisphaera sp. Ch08]|uniref:STAS domain-containing protein n=1 Tax=Singulisphaera sp. Ch08 TaxID=3120278 RepID=A0AAU7CCG1_9BACT